ncbi:MAG: hydroxymethylbilane synthase [Isosphaeraceae bacterium]
MTGATVTILIGTRGSRLARWQSNWVAKRLCDLHPGLRTELVEIKTQGDRDRNSPLAAIGGVGLFTKEVQRAVRDGSVDVAVHSLKDLPTEELAELTLAAVPPREDVADALIAPRHQKLGVLPAAARIGTSSPRRRAQLLYLRPDLEVVTLRGNVETRLNSALQGHFDAVVLAWAGLRRLGLEQHITQRLGPPEFLPAVGQGALGIECRRDASAILALLEPLDDRAARRAVLAERAALAGLQGGCSLPVAAWARDVEEDETTSGGSTLALDIAVYDLDGRDRVAISLRGPSNDPESLGCRAVEQLRIQGAEKLLARMK